MMAAMKHCCPTFAQKKPLRALVALAGLLSASFLAFALVSQYGFGLFPCELCIKQRVPYALIVGVAVLAWGLKISEKWAWWLVLLCAGLFVADAGIAFYHAGVEMHWFPGPSACTASSEPQTLEEMRKAIMEADLVSCDQPMAHVLGLSMAAWNGVAAVGSAALMLLGLRCARKKA